MTDLASSVDVDFLAPEVAKRLEKDLVKKSGTISPESARALVDFYYRVQ